VLKALPKTEMVLKLIFFYVKITCFIISPNWFVDTTCVSEDIVSNSFERTHLTITILTVYLLVRICIRLCVTFYSLIQLSALFYLSILYRFKINCLSSFPNHT